HNVLGYSSTFPHLVQNGSMIWMYFSSNRPGGYGGYDIYVSKFDGKTWSEPMNLGPEINTPGNEITPFLLGDEIYFASDYHHGLGGFDIFIALRKNGMWSRPINAGNGVNSPGDDLYPFVASDDEKVIYFTSNRIGGVGNLDIYKATHIAEPEKTFVFDHFIEDIPLMVSENKEPGNSDKTTVSPANVDVDHFHEGLQSGQTAMDEKPKVLTYEGSLDDLIENEKPDVYVLESTVTSENPVIVSADLENARMVALDEPVQNGSMVYFVQLAAFSRSVDNAHRFKNLVRYGNLYQVSESNLVKLRLGYYFDENHAREVLKTVKEQGFKDAFITREQLNTAKMELLFSNLDFDHPSSYMTESKFKGKSQYKVRLAAYEDPMWFDISKAKDIGRIEQWTKGGWTIFICSGYHSLEEAEKARLMALNKGFRDAELVFDNEGILEKVKRN
ncbi:MAG TPA: SPOR domain-containing protein, partial [Saprospiraceae bacterium]|nr:SPOR domain-containing protein [Saprospiraceae bacterium]